MTFRRWFQDYRRKWRSDRLYAELTQQEIETYQDQVDWFLMRMSQETRRQLDRADWSSFDKASEGEERAWEYGRIARRQADNVTKFSRTLKKMAVGKVSCAAYARAEYLFAHRLRPGMFIATKTDAATYRTEIERRLDPNSEWNISANSIRSVLKIRTPIWETLFPGV